MMLRHYGFECHDLDVQYTSATRNILAGRSLTIANDRLAPDFVVRCVGSLDCIQNTLSDEELSEFIQRKEIPFMPRVAIDGE